MKVLKALFIGIFRVTIWCIFCGLMTPIILIAGLLAAGGDSRFFAWLMHLGDKFWG